MKSFKILLFIILLCSCDKNLIIEESLIKEKSFTDHFMRFYISPTNLPGLLSTEYYKVKAYLNTDKSYLVLFSHFNNFKIEDGVKVKIERKQTTLFIKASVKNSGWKLLLQIEDYFLKNSEIDFTIKVKNGTPKGALIRVWENFIIRNNIVKSEMSIVTKEKLLTSAENINFYKQGEGLKWGLKLFRSHLVKGARISPPLL